MGRTFGKAWQKSLVDISHGKRQAHAVKHNLISSVMALKARASIYLLQSTKPNIHEMTDEPITEHPGLLDHTYHKHNSHSLIEIK